MKLVLLVTLMLHILLSGYAISVGGFWGAFPPFEDAWTYQIFSDLTVSIGLLWFFLYRTARRKGLPLWKVRLCGFGIILSGSIAVLIYLLVEKTVIEDL